MDDIFEEMKNIYS